MLTAYTGVHSTHVGHQKHYNNVTDSDKAEGKGSKFKSSANSDKTSTGLQIA